MTNTHRKTTSTTAKIAAVGAFGIGAAIAFPGIAAAQEDPAPTPDTGTLQDVTGDDGSLEDLTGEDGSLEGALDTDLSVDVGSLTLNLNLAAEAPTPGSIEFGSVGVSPNTGSELIDGGLGEDTSGDETGSLSAALAGLGSEAEDEQTAS